MVNNTTPLGQLQKFLNQLFQYNSQDLDFGIYKILHHKKQEVSTFINHHLVDEVKKQLETLEKDEVENLKNQIKELEKEDLIKGWIDANTSDKETLEKYGKEKINAYLELVKRLDRTKASLETENQIYNHLTLFFSRYYDKGDFVSKRRYGKNEKYVIPYNGEETHFHWANQDQYYIKSSESFLNYSFKIPGRQGTVAVHFTLTEAQEKIGNIKSDEPTYFIYSKKESEKKNGEYTFFFEHRPMSDEEKASIKGKQKQDKLNESTYEQINELFKKDLDLNELWKKEKNGKSFLLNKLAHYSQKNNYDFFIHKNLKLFLERELDYYIKSELINVDDLYVTEADSHLDRLKHNLKTIKAFKSIADVIITFVSQVEEFQKKLWEKKKFVLTTEWVITLGKLVEFIGEEKAVKFLEEVIQNEKQIREWKTLFGEETIPAKLSIEILKTPSSSWRNFPIDTINFNNDFRNRLFNELSENINLEKESSGVVLNTDNYHGLELTKDKFYKRIDGLYLDPPYNTNATVIIYKNGFKDSSWITMMSNRMEQMDDFLKEEGIFCVTIDDYEHSNLYKLLEKQVSNRELRNTIIEYNYRGRVKSNFAITHEYGIWGIPRGKDIVTKLRETANDIKRNLRRTGTDSRRFESPTMFYGIEVDNESLKIVDVHDALEKNEPIPKHENSETTMVWPIDDDGVERRWYYGIDRVRDEKNDTVYAKVIKGKIQVHYTKEGKKIRRKTVWTGKTYDASTYGSELINDLFGITELKQFDFPKSIYAVKDSLETMSYANNAWFMDYFGGSGSTFHATQLLNLDGGKRKCLLMEQGDYMYSVIVPRIKKIAYTSDWNKGKPNQKNLDGLGVFFKYQRLEQYEESLENISFNVSDEAIQKALELDEYIPKYFLEFETKGSPTFLNTQSMKNPWSYELKSWDGFSYDKMQAVDLIETFNYLIGLHVEKLFTKNINEFQYQFVYGHNNRSQKILVVWRDVKGWKIEDYEKDAKFLEKEVKQFPYDNLYINDQSQLDNYQPIEEVFRSKMNN